MQVKMKKTLLIVSTLLSKALLLKAERFPYTPLPVQSGFPSGCTDFAMAYPGDTCESLAIKNRLAVFQFLAFNPQIGGISGCPQNVAAWNWYCIGSGNPTAPGITLITTTVPYSAPPASINSISPLPTTPRTTLVTTTVPYSTPPASINSISPPPTTSAPSPATTQAPSPTAVAPCRINDCFRAFKQVHSGLARSSQSSWCTSILGADPPITEPSYTDFPGIPALPAMQCAKMSMPAAAVMSSYCSCFTEGQMDSTAAIGT